MIDSTAITRELGARLRECREHIGLKAAEVAQTLGWPASKVSRLEHGNRRADPIDVAMYLGCCGVAQDVAKPLLNMAQEPDTGFWTQPHHKQLPDNLLSLVMNETTAATICSFQPLLVPGLLQTENYTAEVMRGIITAEPGDIQPRVRARVARQALLSRQNPPQTVFFINEAVLHYVVGGPEVMNEQLLHLVFATARPNVKVRVVPAGVGPHAGMRGPFVMFHYLDRLPMVWLEGEAVSMLVEDRDVVETYRMIRSELYRIALDEEQSRSLLAKVASEHEAAFEEHDRGGGPDLA